MIRLLLNQRTLMVLASFLMLMIPSAADAGTIGGMIRNVVAAGDNIPTMFSLFGYIYGIFLAIVSLFKFKDHVDQPQSTPLSVGMKRFFAAGMLLSLATLVQVVQSNMITNDETLLGASAGNVTAVGTLGAAVGAPGAIDTMIVNFVRDIAGPMQLLFTFFVYIAGSIILIMGIMRLMKRLDDGPKGPAGLGTLMCFFVAGGLFTMADMMGMFLSSFFGDATVLAHPTITANLGFTVADQARVEQVIHALMFFIGLVGMIAFIRGWMVLRAFADGQQGATLAQGLTFLFGGALCINMGALVNTLQQTMDPGGVWALTFN